MNTGNDPDLVRVLHVLPGGSGAPYFKGLARNFDRARFEFHFLTLEDDDGGNAELRELGVTTFGLGAGRGAFGLARAAFRLRQFLDRHRYHVIHLHLFPALVAGGIAGLLGRTPLMIASHHYGREPFLYRGNVLAQWLERSFCRRLDHVVAVSRDIADYLRDEIGLAPERLSLIHYGFDLDDLPASTASDPGREVSEELSLTGSFVVGSVARLHWTKGHEYLLRAVSRLKHEDGVRPRLLLLGTGPDVKALESRVRELGIEREVSFLGYRRDPLPYYRAMDVFCHPSLQKGYEQVTVEAMALGKAVVATAVGIAREVVRDGENGIVVAARDADAIHTALLRLSRDPDLRRALGERAKSDVRRLVPTRIAMSRRYEEIYTGLLLKSRSSSRRAHATLELDPQNPSRR
jgi:glycosyltransferase involved in cell wall biosynthesis